VRIPGRGTVPLLLSSVLRVTFFSRFYLTHEKELGLGDSVPIRLWLPSGVLLLYVVPHRLLTPT